MTVREMIEKLQDLDPNLPVLGVVSLDLLQHKAAVVRTARDIPVQCRCGEHWPCPRRRLWNFWRHDAVVDMARFIGDERRRREALKRDVEMLTGPVNFPHLTPRVIKKRQLEGGES